MGSLWTEDVRMPEFPALEKDIRTQVLIIGGGMTGILCAYFLQKAGVDYCLLEKDTICQGATANASAAITAQQGLIYEKTLQKLGQENAELFLNANLKAVSCYKELGKVIACDMEETDSYLYSVIDRRKLEREIQALGSLGYHAEYVEDTDLPFEVKAAIRFPAQAQFHPLKFAAGISKNLKIYEHSKVREMTEYLALTEHGSVTAEKVIIATHFPFINMRGFYGLKLRPYQTYQLAAQNKKRLQGIYFEADNLGLGIQNFQEYLILGEAGDRTGIRKASRDKIRRNSRDMLNEIAKEYFPGSVEQYGLETWDYRSLDKRPYIGQYSRSTPDLYVAAGFGKGGMTGPMLSAMILSDLVLEKENEYKKIFSPLRNPITPGLFANIGYALTGALESKKNIGKK